MKKFYLIFLLILIFSVPAFPRGKLFQKLEGKIVNSTRITDLETYESKLIRKPKQDGTDWIGFLSPDGKRMVFRYGLEDKSKEQDNELRIIDSGGKNEKILIKTKFLLHFRWSPDSKFIIVDTADVPEIRIINPDNGDVWKIEIPRDKIDSYGTLHWSKDGKRIIFLGWTAGKNGVPGVFQIDLDGKNLKQLALFPEPSSGAISPDEKWVAFVPGDDDIYLMDIEGKSYRRLWKTKKFEHALFWSPDSKWIGAQMRTRDTMHLSEFVVRNIETGARKQLPIYELSFQLQWWAPQTETPPDCETIVREMLGPPSGKIEIIPVESSAESSSANGSTGSP